jgi:hypothetical protein
MKDNTPVPFFVLDKIAYFFYLGSDLSINMGWDRLRLLGNTSAAR